MTQDKTGDSEGIKGKISLAPLTFEQAMKGLLAAGPHPKDDEPEPAEDKATLPKRRRAVRKAKPSTDS